MKIKQKFRKVMATLLSVAMVMTLCVGLDFGAVTASAEGTEYEFTVTYGTDGNGTANSVIFTSEDITFDENGVGVIPEFDSTDTLTLIAGDGVTGAYIYPLVNNTSYEQGGSTPSQTSALSNGGTLNWANLFSETVKLTITKTDETYSSWAGTFGGKITVTADPVDSSGSTDEGEEVPTYTITLDASKYTGSDTLMGWGNDINGDQQYLKHGGTIEIPTNGTVDISAGVAFTAVADGATVGELQTGGEAGYYLTISNFTKDTTIVINPDPSEEETTYNVKLDCTNYTETRVDLYTYDSEQHTLEYISTNGDTITVPGTGFARVFVYGGEFTVTAEGAVVGEIINSEEGYYCEITNFTKDTTVVVNAASGEEEEEDTPTGATYTFSHAYDCQRNPAFPKKGDSVTMSGFRGPYTGTSFDNSAIAAGWSLVSDGKYNSTTHTKLSNLVNSLKYEGYSVDAADMEVYKLVRKDTNAVVATGFIFTTMGSDGLLYISSNDYGYYICDKALTGSDEITAIADGDISDPAIPGGSGGEEEPPHVCKFGDWVITKEATAEADGEKERKCECGETETAVVKFVPEADENTGILTEDTKPEDNACNADIEIDVEDVITDIGLTDEEILAIENGEDISVYLEVKNADATVLTEDKTTTENALAADMKVGMYLDIDLLKKIGNNNPTAITETKQPITITFEMPDELINTNTTKTRTYKIIRVHNGVATVLACSFNSATKKASFETDKFSSYAIAYVDTIDGGNNSGSTGGNSGGNTTPTTRPNYPTVVIKPTTPEKDDDKDNDYEGEDVSSAASVELDETMLEIGSASESDVTVYITFTMFTLSVAYAIFKKKKHE